MADLPTSSSSSSSSATYDPQKGMVGSLKVDLQKGNEGDGVDPPKGNPISQLHSGGGGEEVVTCGNSEKILCW